MLLQNLGFTVQEININQFALKSLYSVHRSYLQNKIWGHKVHVSFCQIIANSENVCEQRSDELVNITHFYPIC